MYADVTVITLDGLHKTLIWLVLILSVITFVFWKFGGKKGSGRKKSRAAGKKRASSMVRKALRPSLKSKANNRQPHSISDIR